MSGRLRFGGAFSLVRVSGWVRVRRSVVVVVVPVVVAALLAGVPGVASAAGGGVGEPPVVDVPRSVPVAPVAGRARVVAESEGAVSSPRPVVVWPAAGVAEVRVPASAGAQSRAGALPVWVSPAGGASTDAVVSRARVEVLDQSASARVGVRGVLLRVSRVDGVAGPGPVSVEVDYSGFGHAYGANFGARLTLVSLPGCVLTTSAEASCQRMVPVAGVRNNPVSARLTARVDVAGAGAGGVRGRLAPGDASGGGSLFAVAPASVTDGADFSKTSLSPALSWSAGTQGGEFSTSYPLRVPPGLGGPVPSLGLGYSSGSVDGRTNSEGAQAPVVGEGWGLTGGGFIERRYRRCADDQSPAPTYTNATGDLCWRLQNATIAWGGRSTELVLDDGVWRLAGDDGSRVELLTGAVNGDDDGEHWKVTTTGGTQYFFGLNRLPGWTTGKPVTQSALVVPVFGNHAGEPCYKTTGFASSWCPKAWRWNLDYVVDPHGSSMSYWYGKPVNKTALAGVLGATTFYDRDGDLIKIEYGTRAGQELTTTPRARVNLTYWYRCVLSDAQCWVGNGPGDVEDWRDTPWDFNCQQSPCGNNLSPTFWSSVRLRTVTTQVRGAGVWRDVDRWELTHAFPPTGETGHDPSLWLERVEHTGLVGGSETLPATVFGGTKLANRTDFNTTVGIPKAFKYRVTTVDNGTGGQVLVGYEGSDCTQSTQDDPDNNERRCFRQWFSPPGGTPSWSWWNKYRVTSVTERDLTGGSPDVEHSYAYSTAGSSSAVLWHHNDDSYSTPIGLRDWSIWRGWPTVTVTDGPAAGVGSQTVYLYFRGMHADRTDAGPGTRVATVTDSAGVPVDDANHLAGFLRERTVLDGPGGAVLSGQVHDPWSHQTARRVLPAGWGTPLESLAHYTRTGATRTRTWLAHSSSWRRTETDITFDTTYGQPTLVEDRGDVAVGTDDVCTSTSYARNTTLWLVDYPAQALTTSCATTPTGGDFLAGGQVLYDGSTTVGAAPTRGLPTKTQVLASVSGTTLTWAQKARAGYDANGRVLNGWDPLDRVTTTAYTPPTGGPVTATTVTNALAHVTTVTVEPAWGLPTRVVDPNNKVTDAAYDPLGRLVGVWLPGRDRQLPANTEYTYTVRASGGSTALTARTLGPNGDQVTGYELFDGLLRPRQTQSVAPDGNRVVADTAYDERGLAVKASVFYNNTVPTDVLVTFADTAVDRQVTTVHDTLNRPVHVITMTNGVELWRTSAGYDGDRSSTTPPAGGTATTSIADARGRKAELRQYQASTPTGGYDATTYAYDRLGRLTRVTDPVGNDWDWTFDPRGRQLTAVDPDKGSASMAYDAAGQMLTSTDARGEVIANVHDLLGRVVERRDATPAGAPRASWVYDTLAKGQLTSSTRHDGAAAYTTTVTGFTDRYQPTGVSVSIPAVETGLAGTHVFASTYNVDGSVSTASLPASGGLAAETLTTTYTNTGLVSSVAGLSTYLAAVSYDWDGQVTQQTLGSGADRVRLSSDWENSTGRLSRTQVHTEHPGTPNTWDEVLTEQYRWYDAGTLKSQTEQHSAVTTSAQCFTYDHLRRLKEAWTNAAFNCTSVPANIPNRGPDPYWTTWTFDPTGNRLTQLAHGVAGGADATTTYAHPAAGGPKPHTLTSSTSPAGTDTYGYDAAGNTTTRNVGGTTQALTWDAEGHLATHVVNGQTHVYLYGADGARLIRRDPTGATLYLPGGTELRHTTATTLTTCTRHYPNAVRTSAGLVWTVGDHHGTRQTAIDTTTLAVTRRLTTPYGQTRGTPPGTWPGDKGFIDGTTDPTGLTHLGAREYDPATGRFISVDPLIDTEDPQQMNGYTYADNNPTTLTDPNGLAPVCLDECGSKEDRDYQETVREERAREVARGSADQAPDPKPGPDPQRASPRMDDDDPLLGSGENSADGPTGGSFGTHQLDWCNEVGILTCLKAIWITQAALDLAKNVSRDMGSSWTNGQKNAFRHTYWMARLTVNGISVEDALALGNAHEADNDLPNRLLGTVDAAADQHNNGVGVRIGDDHEPVFTKLTGFASQDGRDEVVELIVRELTEQTICYEYGWLNFDSELG